MNALCEMVFILDRSGSMNGLEADTIGGFNSMIEEQRKKNVNAMITVALFDDRLDIPFKRESLDKIPEMTDEIYFTRGCTALFDAVGTMITQVTSHRRHLAPAEMPEKTVFVITTDGYENASREWSGSALKRLIEQKQEEGWEFLYLGANIDASVEAEKIGIRAERAVRYHNDSTGVRNNYATVGHALVDFACSAPSAPMSDSWSAEIEKDFRSRKSSR